MASRSSFRVENHSPTMLEILVGSVEYSPTLFSRTNGMLPSSWHGMQPLSTTGRPVMSASAMVPGPALVMMASLAPIHSDMLVTKPHTLTRKGQSMLASLLASRWLRPQMTTTCACGGSALASALAVASSFPIPSPPPTSSTVGASAIPSCLRSLALAGSGLEKAGRIGKPCSTTCLSVSPYRSAFLRTSSVGTKHLSTIWQNHVLWHDVRSVTTVANGVGRGAPCLRALTRSALSGTCCMSGCTDTTRSGLYWSKARERCPDSTAA
mmetsp:Transcript_21581/g.69771  ORF Transcript_21581/g.69771 Transcript_21581/m.69771 type:complete len:267 (-) Transcript_21581:322-1122(-)